MWSAEKIDLLKKTLVPPDITDIEFALFLEICKSRALNPFNKHLYAIKRGGKLVIQTSIDGYRLLANRTGKYMGQLGPFWCGKDGEWKDIWTPSGNPFAAKIGALRSDFAQPVWGVAYWDMYVAQGPFWSKGGPSQLAKCAEALALRKAFPEELSGLYTDDEMYQADGKAVDTIVNAVVDPEQPTMIFPAEAVQSWSAKGDNYALVKDSNGLEWVFTGENIPVVDKALAEHVPLVVNYVVDTGRKIVTAIQS